MPWKNRKVLVTGGAGVIGRELIKQLIPLGSRILCIDRKQIPNDLSSFKSLQYEQNDISDMNLEIIKKFDPEVIFHLAASFERTEESTEFWDVSFRDNIVVTHRIIDLTKKLFNLRKFIFASSYLVYNPFLYLFKKPPKNARKLLEDSILDSRNLIASSKFYNEKELKFMGVTYGKFITISARIFRVYGCGSKDVISRWVRMAPNDQELTVYRKENKFDYIYAGDVSLGLIKLCERISSNKTVNLGTGRAVSVKEVIDNFKNYFSKLKIKEINYVDHFEASCADMKNFRKFTNWIPRITVKEGIKK